MKESDIKKLKVGDRIVLKRAYGLSDGYIIRGEVEIVEIKDFLKGLKAFTVSDGKRSVILTEEDIKENLIDGYKVKPLVMSKEDREKIARLKKRLEEWEKSLPEKIYKYGGRVLNLDEDENEEA